MRMAAARRAAGGAISIVAATAAPRVVIRGHGRGIASNHMIIVIIGLGCVFGAWPFLPFISPLV
jgi:hypothetical protein